MVVLKSTNCISSLSWPVNTYSIRIFHIKLYILSITLSYFRLNTGAGSICYLPLLVETGWIEQPSVPTLFVSLMSPFSFHINGTIVVPTAYFSRYKPSGLCYASRWGWALLSLHKIAQALCHNFYILLAQTRVIKCLAFGRSLCVRNYNIKAWRASFMDFLKPIRLFC